MLYCCSYGRGYPSPVFILFGFDLSLLKRVVENAHLVPDSMEIAAYDANGTPVGSGVVMLALRCVGRQFDDEGEGRPNAQGSNDV